MKAVRRVQEFTWTMSKLQLLIESSLDEPGSIMRSYVKFVNEVTENDDDKHFYQNIPLARYNSAVRNVKAHYTATIANVTSCMENRFESLQASALFKHLIALLDVTSWPSANI